MTNCEFSIKGVEEYESQVPYLGKMLPATEQYSVANIDSEKQRVNLVWVRKIDKDKSQALIEQALVSLAKELNEKAPKPGSIKGYDVSSKGDYEIDLKTGWPVRIALEHRAGVEGSLSIRSMTIESR